jgi:hypothetical protein
MDQLARRKVVDKIQKLLRLAEGKANENESATAARQAEALMRKFNLEMKDVILEDLRQRESINANWSRAAANMGPKSYHKRVPIWAQWIAVGVADLFDCHSFIGFVHGVGKVVRFVGYVTDVEVCKWTFDYLISEVRRHTKNFITENDASTTEADAYRNGITLRLQQRLAEAVLAKRAADDKSKAGMSLAVAKRSAINAALGFEPEYHAASTKAMFDKMKDAGLDVLVAFKGGFDKADTVHLKPNPLSDKQPKGRPRVTRLLK